MLLMLRVIPSLWLASVNCSHPHVNLVTVTMWACIQLKALPCSQASLSCRDLAVNGCRLEMDSRFISMGSGLVVFRIITLQRATATRVISCHSSLIIGQMIECFKNGWTVSVIPLRQDWNISSKCIKRRDVNTTSALFTWGMMHVCTVLSVQCLWIQEQRPLHSPPPSDLR